MGMFSWKCKGCGAEICEPEVALVKSRHGITWGPYDGYGRLGMYDYNENGYPDEPVMWHKLCYDKAPIDKQSDMTPSKYAPNQGCDAPNPKFL